MSPDFERKLKAALQAGTREHYLDATLYDHEYGRRRTDVDWYRRLAGKRPTRILEMGSGTGRLMVPLCKDGHTVFGVDLSATMLRRARERLARAGQAVSARATLHQGDFRALSLGRRFPLVISPFNAFQHLYTRDDVERFLAVVRAHLQPGGRFAFDVLNPDLKWLSRDSTKKWARTRFRHPVTGAKMVYSTNLVYDAPLQIAFMRIYYQPERGGRERIVRLTHRYFFPLELEALLHYNGFSVESHIGFDDKPLLTEGEEQVLVCRLRKGPQGKRIAGSSLRGR